MSRLETFGMALVMSTVNTLWIIIHLAKNSHNINNDSNTNNIWANEEQLSLKIQWDR